MADRSLLGPADVDDATFTGIVARALGEDPHDVTVLESRRASCPTPSTRSPRPGATGSRLGPRPPTASGRRGCSSSTCSPGAAPRSSGSCRRSCGPWPPRACRGAPSPSSTGPTCTTGCRRGSPCRSPCTWPSSTTPRRRSGCPRWTSSTTTGTQPTSPVRRTCSVGSPAAPRWPSSPSSATPTAGRARCARTPTGGWPYRSPRPCARSDLWQAPWVADAFDADLRAAAARPPSTPCRRSSTSSRPGPRAPPTVTPARTTCCAPPGRTTSPSSTTGSSAGSAVGFDLGQLLVGDVQIGRRAAATLPETEAACLPAYVDGPARRRGRGRRRHGGAGARPAPARLHRAVRPADGPAGPGADAGALAHDAHERAAIARFCLDLVERRRAAA